MAQYRALVGIDYPPNKRAEAGEIISDLPGDAIKWLLADGLIEDASKPAKKIEEPVEETPVVEETKAVEETPVVEETSVAEEVIAEPVVETTEEASEEKEAE